jgi:hypothetical protein
MDNKENLRKYIWNYFQLHAGQRLTTFNFYIVISTLLTSGYFVAVRDVPYLSLLLGIILVVFSYVFWKLDVRNKQLIRNAEKALMYIESKEEVSDNTSEPHILNIFSYEHAQTQALKENHPFWFWKNLYTYSTCPYP